MSRTYFTLFLITLLIIQLQTVESLNSKRAKRTVKDIPANCKYLRHDKTCINNDNKQSGSLTDRFSNKNIKPQPFQKLVAYKFFK